MNGKAEPDQTGKLWSWVDGERKLDRRVRRIFQTAWGVTVVAVVLYAASVLMNVAMRLSHAAAEGHPSGELFVMALDHALPLIMVLGMFSLLVAVLSTIAIFLRFRTASLAEIQARLAAMEEVLLNDSTRS